MTRCHRPGCGSARIAPGATLPYAATRPRSLRERSTIITCSAASLAEPSSASAPASRGAVPLIGEVVTTSPVRRRNSSGENERTARSPPRPRNAPWRGSSSPAAARNASAALPRKRPSRRSVTLAWNSSPAAIRSTQPATAAVWRASAPGAGSRPVERRTRRAGAAPNRAAQLVEPRQRALVERLEPPGAVRVLAQDVVVEAEARDRQRHRPRRRAGEGARSRRRARSPGSRTSRPPTPVAVARPPCSPARRAPPAPRRRAAAPSPRSPASPPSRRRARTAARRRARRAPRRRARARARAGRGPAAPAECGASRSYPEPAPPP